MTTYSVVPEDHPLMIAWKAYQSTVEFDNAEKWAAYPEHRLGSMWAMFAAGFKAGAEGSPSEAPEQPCEK